MSEQPSGFRNPQILVAVIGAITTVAVAAIGVLPSIIGSTRPPTPTNTPIVITATTSATPMPTTEQATQVSATDIPTEITVVASDAQPTPLPVIEVPTTAAVPDTQNLQNVPPNVRLMYDSVSFTLLNESGHVLSLEGVRFRGGCCEWDARDWGPSIHNSIPDGKCVRLRDATVGQRQPPAPCQNNIYGLIEVGAGALFWKDGTSFEVVRSGVVIATCAATEGAGTCELFIG